MQNYYRKEEELAEKSSGEAVGNSAAKGNPEATQQEITEVTQRENTEIAQREDTEVTLRKNNELTGRDNTDFHGASGEVTLRRGTVEQRCFNGL